jgi:membrane associated rhomboid family serine protease
MIESFQILLNNILRTALTMGLFVVALWVIYFVDTVLLHNVLKKRFGLVPRAGFKPLSILISPMLHVNVRHLAANSIPFFVLGSLVLVQGQLIFWLTTFTIIVIAGLGIWLFGQSNTQHMGASGLILGYFGYTLASAFFNPDLASIVVAVIVAILYLGLIWQVVPLKKGVSTTGHLFGFLGGIVAAGFAALLPPLLG